MLAEPDSALAGTGVGRVASVLEGLDLYSLHNSIRAVLDYLDDVDPSAPLGDVDQGKHVGGRQ